MNTYETAQRIVGIFNVFLDGSAALAGGCVRDRVLGIEPKDYDVFIEYTDKNDLKELNILADRMGWNIDTETTEYEEDTTGRVKMIVALTKLGYQKIDIIFTNWTLRNCIEAFPSSISQAWEVGGVVNTTPAFDRTIETNTIVFTNGKECKHVQKVLDYFPTYKHIFKEK